jgi:iron complex outermembrane receptor protein
MKDYAAVRYGGQIAPNLYFRLYEQQFDQGDTKLANGNPANDGWTMTQGGFRMDYMPSNKNTFTLHGDIYGGKEENPANSMENGQNIFGKWTHKYSDRSELTIQTYFDRTWRNLPRSNFIERLNTYDLDIQHRFRLAAHHHILWGIGYRLMDDDTNNSPAISFNPSDKILHLVNTFIQDQITLVPRKLEFTVGTKLLYNDYSGYEFQPSARLSWLTTPRTTIWAAVSRAVRTPSRFETDEITATLTTPGANFLSENVIAYELGYRMRPAENISFSIATYYNTYDNLRSINRNPTPPTTFIFANDQKANSWGVEISGNVIATSWWRLRGGYTYMDKTFTSKSAAVLATSSAIEALDPKNQATIQSIMNLPAHLQFDVTGRFVDKITTPFAITTSVDAYTTFDARFAWEHKGVTISLRGQNLVTADHKEFGQRQVPRNVTAKLTIRL